MGLFNAVGKLFNTTAEVGMWIVIGFALLLVVIVVIIVSCFAKIKNVDFDFSGLDATVYNAGNEIDKTDAQGQEEFISLKTDAQFEAAKIKKVVATANEDIAYAQAQAQAVEDKKIKDKKDSEIKNPKQTSSEKNKVNADKKQSKRMPLLKKFNDIFYVASCFLAVDGIHTKHIKPTFFNTVTITIT